MTRTVYIVGHNLAGYLPESEPRYVWTERAAISASYEDARADLAAYNEDAPRQHRYTMTGRDGDYWLTTSHGADYHYWFSPAIAERGYVMKQTDSPIYCGNCERRIEDERAYHVLETDDWVCEDCL